MLFGTNYFVNYQTMNMQNPPRLVFLFFAAFLFSVPAFGQKSKKSIQNYLNTHQNELELSKSDLSNWEIINEHTSDKDEITYTYVRQTINGVPVYNAIANFASAKGKLIMTGNRFVKNISDKINTTSPSISQEEAIIAAADHFQLNYGQIRLVDKDVFSVPSLSQENIPVKLMYLRQDNELRLVWDLSIYTIDSQNWWSTRVDAQSGKVLDQANWVVSCDFGDHPSEPHVHATPKAQQAAMLPAPPPSTDQYNVFELPVESPNHGSRTLVVGPSDNNASPFGWHDDNGIDGPEYTITRGNNVYATEDQNNDNNPGYAPDGGSNLSFDFPLNINQPASGYWDPAITNLFYMNNMMHDIWYHYGFDEASGNFQQNNYGNGGVGSDMVLADAQDGGGTNNANFASPPDGNNPRMQMFLWDAGGSSNLFTVNAPASIAGNYTAVEANFGPNVPATPITSDLVIFEDATPDTYDACEVAINGPQLAGKIVVIRRGGCPFVEKVTRAQDEGALAVIVINNVAGNPFAMGGTGTNITIPSVMISGASGAALLAELEAGGTVNATLGNTGPFDYDGDFDNGIIAHEYGHGISIRLTGGASTSGCLANNEQMGEGWSDWFGLMLTIEPGDQASDIRGIGTFAVGQSTTGNGIRPAPYSTSFGINNFTYDATNNTGSISQPHGIGFVWSTMLWDLTWALIDEYGYDSDLHYGTGGNNIAMDLVINGLKLQPCGPGFVDGRDAILQADQLLYNGAHECLIWNVFANRGLGYSASQGDPDSRTDQVEAFDLPPSLNINSSVTACETYTWPINGMTYTTSGTYTSAVGNLVGCDSVATLNLTITNSTINPNVTQLNNFTLQAEETGATYQWVDCNNNFSPISGATGQTFTASNNGNYAVIITLNGCSDTSECVNLNEVGLIESTFGSQLEVFPNPTNGELTISFGEMQTSIEATILDASGRIIEKIKAVDTKQVDVLLNGESGVYFLEVTNETGSNARVKLIKR